MDKNKGKNTIQTQMSLKKITFIDVIKKKLKMLFGYREGKRFIDDTKPFIKSYSDIELSIIANIEKRLKYILDKNSEAEKLVDGLEKEDAEKLLEWIVQRDRTILDKESASGIVNNDLLGYCGLSQGIVSTLLANMGLNPRNSNINPTITGHRSWRTCV